MKTKFTPEYSGTLRSHLLTVPKCISECGGIRIFGRRIKSLVFSTDVAIIKNVNADAIIAVYPFTPQPSITQAIISVSEVPVFVGVGGGMTNGDRSVRLAEYSEHQGASGVVVNAPITNETIAKMKQVVDIPVITTIVSGDMDIAGRLAAGADILNVSGAAKTPEIVAKIRGLDWKIGRNLNAFNDILRGGFGRHEYGQPIHIQWLAYEKSVRNLGKETMDTIVEIILDTDHSGHDCTLERL